MLEVNEVFRVEIDGLKRHVYIKLRDNNRQQQVLPLTGGQVEYRHTNVEDTTLSLCPLAGFHGSVRQDLPRVFFQAGIGIWF